MNSHRRQAPCCSCNYRESLSRRMQTSDRAQAPTNSAVLLAGAANQTRFRKGLSMLLARVCRPGCHYRSLQGATAARFLILACWHAGLGAAPSSARQADIAWNAALSAPSESVSYDGEAAGLRITSSLDGACPTRSVSAAHSGGARKCDRAKPWCQGSATRREYHCVRWTCGDHARTAVVERDAVTRGHVREAGSRDGQELPSKC